MREGGFCARSCGLSPCSPLTPELTTVTATHVSSHKAPPYEAKSSTSASHSHADSKSPKQNEGKSSKSTKHAKATKAAAKKDEGDR